MKIEFNIDKNACFVCTSHVPDKDGYIEVKRNGERGLLHRMMYELFSGESLSKGDVVIHKCDNPACFNPKHLRKGTHAENVQDRVGKRRSAIGSYNGRSKLTDDNVRHIILNELNLADAELGRKYGVSRRVFYDIRRGNTWKHLSHLVDDCHKIDGNKRRSERAVA